MNPRMIKLLGWLAVAIVSVATGTGTYAMTVANRHAHEDVTRQLASARATQPRVQWSQTQHAQPATLPVVQTSPIERPVAPVVTDKPEPVVITPPTDAELQAQLQAELNRRFPLVMIAWSEDGSLEASAFVGHNRTHLHVWVGTSLAEQGTDAVVTAIARDHIKLDAAMPGHEGKRFDVQLTLKEHAPLKLDWTAMQVQDELLPAAQPQGDTIKPRFAREKK
ncbi:MAG: hypothetical protein IT464_03625 [Planctomycetes bacterium]|nr:hypothetical protein [Planctomycetota bacterium]